MDDITYGSYIVRKGCVERARNHAAFPDDIRAMRLFLPALVFRPLDDEGEAAVAAAVDLVVVVAAVPHQAAVRAQPQRAPPRARPLVTVVALPFPV